jgi:hypothetical protein
MKNGSNERYKWLADAGYYVINARDVSTCDQYVMQYP